MQRLTIAMLVAPLLAVAQPLAAQEASGSQPLAPLKGDAPHHVLHPWALNEFIEQLGGHRVTLVKARVLTVLNPRALLIETATMLPPVPRRYDRVLVFMDAGALRIEPELIVDATVRVIGVARTLVGMQITREVPWPAELTREVLKRYDIRAVVLATSVQTADGVELIGK